MEPVSKKVSLENNSLRSVARTSSSALIRPFGPVLILPRKLFLFLFVEEEASGLRN